ncbi:zinc finger protein [Stylonychia lemnae]|uniref:Zinc finger protein n=1 Tax=Stylonychia lemnae TaxID=5949 RepID=A0A078A3X5_STYLE|nr:zinc finger protein [Stylonychia lemnae]|eukprot:CDW76963.1 zinc finger protein [Stylonychia lemnae]
MFIHAIRVAQTQNNLGRWRASRPTGMSAPQRSQTSRNIQPRTGSRQMSRRIQRRQTQEIANPRQFYFRSNNQVNPFTFNEQYINHILNRSMQSDTDTNLRLNRLRQQAIFGLNAGIENDQDDLGDPRLQSNWTSLLIYAQKRQTQYRQIKRDLVINIVLFFAFLIILLFSIKLDTQLCGKQHQIWIGLYTLFYFTKVVITTYQMFLAHRNKQKLIRQTSIIKSLVFNPIQIAWLVYGNILFYTYNIEKECGPNQSDMTRLSTFLLIIMIVGYIQLVYFLLTFLFLLYVYFKRREQINIAQEQEAREIEIIENAEQIQFPFNQDQNQYHLRLLVTNLDPYLDKLELYKFQLDLTDPQQLDECAICLNKFVQNEDLIILKCDKRHYFHKDCAREWIKIKANCPLCRQEFKNEIIHFRSNSIQLNNLPTVTNIEYQSNDNILNNRPQIIESNLRSTVMPAAPPQPSRSRLLQVINMFNEIDSNNSMIIPMNSQDESDQIQNLGGRNRRRARTGRRNQSNIHIIEPNATSIIHVINTIAYHNPQNIDTQIQGNIQEEQIINALARSQTRVLNNNQRNFDANDPEIDMRNFRTHLNEFRRTQRQGRRHIRRFNSQDFDANTLEQLDLQNQNQ